MDSFSHHQRGGATPLNLSLLLCVFAIAWLLWSGIYKPMVLGLGAFSCVVAVVFASRMGFFAQSSELLSMIRRLPRYWLWLGGEILVSSWKVARIVLNPSLKVEPTMVEIKASDLEEMGQTILGNSITLSPGTVTIDIDEGELLVHCLKEEDARALQQGDLINRIRGLRRS